MHDKLPIRRSLLFVPGAEPRKLERARQAGADTLLLDLEDSVVPDQKESAREQVAGQIRAGGFERSEIAVRVNPPGTPFFDEDLGAVVAAGARSIMLPKSETPESLLGVAESLERLEANLELERGCVRLLALVESAAGISRVNALPEATVRIEALCFGNADFSLDMGLPEGDPATGTVFHARCSLAIAAVASRVTPVDGVCLAVKDAEAFAAEASTALRLGFEGKMCIHPAQVEIANRVFTPSTQQIDTALRVVSGWEEALAERKGVFVLDGKMVDAPLVEVHRRVLERARRAGELSES